MTIPQTPRTTLTIKINIIGDMMQSLRYIFSKFGLKIMVLMVGLYGFFATPAYVMFPMLVNKHLGGDVTKLGVLNSVFGVGMIVGGLFLGIWAGFKKRILTSASGSTLQGILLILLGFTTIELYPYVIAYNFLLGVGVSLASAPIAAILNSVIAKDMQGRVFTLFSSLTGAMTPLGLAVAGPVADTFGIHVIYFIAGGALLVLMPLGLLSRTQRDL
jgi:DHA3 family macrolide efflux protein-like MFS transporter